MSAFSNDLLRASARLYSRKKGQKGPLKSAYIRRSISTTYYALFHFILDESASQIIGTSHRFLQRRRLFIRTLSHTGLTTAFSKLKGNTIDKSVEDLFRLHGTPAGSVTTPIFVKNLATAYLDAKAKREDADYNLSASLSETDARQLRRRVKKALKDWEAANSQADRDAKSAVSLLVSLKGRLRD
ncbi:hypothetical protein [Komagataeibacter diospyri]|uniref:hypothetical protein n=1 Tax=Komagataeibacter diospyri TaxID=1932662 RepID=UPI0037565E62